MKQEQEIEAKILRLLEQYHHYLFMTSGFWLSWFKSMNLAGFMYWLKSRED